MVHENDNTSSPDNEELECSGEPKRKRIGKRIRATLLFCAVTYRSEGKTSLKIKTPLDPDLSHTALRSAGVDETFCDPAAP